MLNQLLKDLENAYLFDKKHNSILAKIEACLALAAGAFIGSFFYSLEKKDLLLAAILTAIFLYLFYRRLSKESQFSMSALGELKSTIALNDAKKEIERKILIEDGISNSVKFLNNNTCNYNVINSENSFCEQGISKGLLSIYEPYFSNLHNLLNTSTTKFTVGAYINGFLKLPENFEVSVQDPYVERDIFIEKDDFDFNLFFVKDILTNQDLLDLSFLFQTHFLNTFKHGKFLQNSFLHDEKEFTLITAPIPTVRDDGAVGVFFMITEKLPVLPADLENVTKVFGRLFSNWLSKYNECVYDRWISNAEKILSDPEPTVQTQARETGLETHVVREIDNDTAKKENENIARAEHRRNLTNIYAKKDLFQGSLGL